MKILASDFDGTFYVDSAFDPADLEAVKAFQKAGNLFGFCTGRPLNGITPFFDQWDFRPDFYIVNTGSVVLDKEMHYLLQTESTPVLSKTLSGNTKTSISSSTPKTTTSRRCQSGPGTRIR